MMPKGRIGDRGHHHDWLSRDWLDIDCKAVGCFFNRGEKCMVPSRCKIGDNGGCSGFRSRETPKRPDGD